MVSNLCQPCEKAIMLATKEKACRQPECPKDKPGDCTNRLSKDTVSKADCKAAYCEIEWKCTEDKLPSINDDLKLADWKLDYKTIKDNAKCGPAPKPKTDGDTPTGNGTTVAPGVTGVASGSQEVGLSAAVLMVLGAAVVS